jgi:hypothetical protein
MHESRRCDTGDNAYALERAGIGPIGGRNRVRLFTMIRGLFLAREARGRVVFAREGTRVAGARSNDGTVF